MKRFALALAALACGTLAANADPVFGNWKSEPGETGSYIHVNIAQCGSLICGTITEVIGADNDTIVGKPIIWDMKVGRNGKYSGGKIWAPDTDKTYRSKMQLTGDLLKVSGCVGPICRGQTWSRL